MIRWRTKASVPKRYVELENFELYYEETERYVVQTKKVADTQKESKSKKSFSTRLAPVRSRINNVISKLKPQRKKAKKLTKSQRDEVRNKRKSAILGIGLLLTIVSIAYSTTIVYLLVSSWTSLLALVPQVAFALIISYKAFSNLFK